MNEINNEPSKIKKRNTLKNRKKIINLIILILFIILLCMLYMLGTFKHGKGVRENSTNHLVSFYSQDKSLIEVIEVEDQGAVVPPASPVMPVGYIFISWDKDLSCITKDMDVYPICEVVSDDTNVFALSGAGGKKGDTVSVPLDLIGNVCTAGFELAILYDSNELRLDEIVNEDGAVIYNDETSGIIQINYVSVENTIGEVSLCEMKFEILADQGSIPIQLEMKSIYKLTGEESMEQAEYKLINTDIQSY